MYIFPASVDDTRRIAEIHIATWRAAYVGIVPDDFLAGLSVDQRETYWRQEIPLGKQQVGLAKLDDAEVGWVSFGPSRDKDAQPAAAEIWAIYVDLASTKAFTLGGATLMEIRYIKGVGSK